jgi:hypothetical protein
VIHLKYLSLIYCIPLFLFIGCIGDTFIKPAPDAYEASPDPSERVDDESSEDSTSQIDFSAAIPDPEDIESRESNRLDSARLNTSDSLNEKKTVASTKSFRYPSFKESKDSPTGLQAFVGFKVNGNFSFVQIPFVDHPLNHYYHRKND